jgi:uncharacterized membrane protein YhaH (DUF805 family)
MQIVPQQDCCTCFKLGFQNYANCEGRSRRSEYWYFHLVLSLIIIFFYIIIAVSTVNMSTTGSAKSTAIMLPMIVSIIFFLVMLVFLIPSISVTVRRLHDTGRPGIYYLVGLIPFAGPFILLYFCCLDSDEGPNMYGASPKYILPPQTAVPLNPTAGYVVQPAVVLVPVSPAPQPNPMPPQMAPYPGQIPPPQGFAPY